MYPILKGSTSVILTVEMRGVDGQPETGLAHGDVTCSYSREGEATGATVVALSAGAAGVYGSGHWCEADPANAAGLYQFGVPAAALATGARSVSFRFDAAGCFTRTVHVRLLAANLDDAVRMGLTGLPNATAGAEGGVPVLAASGLVVKSVTDAVTLTGAYDAAKTAASAANLAALQGDVTAIGVDVTALADVDVPAVKAVVDGLAVSLAALDAAVGALENVSVADVTAGILAGVVDSARTVAQILRRLDAYAGGNITRVDRATTYKREDGATTEMTHTIPVGALSRIVS